MILLFHIRIRQMYLFIIIIIIVITLLYITVTIVYPPIEKRMVAVDYYFFFSREYTIHINVFKNCHACGVNDMCVLCTPLLCFMLTIRSFSHC